MLISLDNLPQSTRLIGPTGARPCGEVEVGEMMVAVGVMAANVVKDIRENLRNLVGGRMRHYETLIEAAVEAALDDLAAKATARGYDGVIGVKVSHPNVVDGGVEVVVYGNGFRFAASAPVAGEDAEASP